MAKQPQYAKASAITRDVLELVKAPNRAKPSTLLPDLVHVEQNGVMTPYDISLTPYMCEPMDLISSREYDSVIFVGAARSGKSLALVEGGLAYAAAVTKADCLLVHISQQRASEFSKRQLDRSFNSAPLMKEALSPSKHDNGIHLIKLKAGNFLTIGHPSKNVFASQSYRVVLITDLDRLPLSVDGEGDALLLSSKRTQTYMSSGMVIAESSPGHEIADRAYRVSSAHESPPVVGGILNAYNDGDRRLMNWQCPDCNGWFEPSFDTLIYDRGELDPSKAAQGVAMMCPHCGCTSAEDRLVEGQAYKIWANKNCRWVPEGCWVDENGVVVGERRKTRRASYWQKGPSSAFQSWGQLVSKYVSALNIYEQTGDCEPLKATVNTDQGMPFAPPRSTERDIATLMDRAHDFGIKVVPPEARFLIATIDVQGGAKTRRWEVQVEAFGEGLQSWIVDRFPITKSRREDEDKPGSFVRVMPGTYVEDWKLITEKVINRSYPIDDGSGRSMRVLRTLCDSNGEEGVTDTAYKYWRELKKDGLHSRFMLVKGSSRKAAPLVEKRYPDNSGRTDRKAKVSGDVPVYMLNTDRVKDLVSASLNRPAPGPLYVNFPHHLPESFYAELIAEDRDASGHWEKVSKSSSNEALDLMAYARAGLRVLKADKITNWERCPSWALPLDENSEVFTPADEEQQEIKPRLRRRRR